MNKLISKFGLFYPVRFLTGQNFYYYYRKFIKYENLCWGEMQDMLFMDLRKVIENAFARVPYYNDMAKNLNLDYRDIRGFSDLVFLEPLSKNIFRENILRFKREGSQVKFKRSTSGSTGMPMVFYKDRYSMAAMDAAMFSGYRWHSIFPGDSQARFWGTPIGKGDRKISLLKDILMNRKRFSAFSVSEHEVASFFQKILRFGPSYFYGYPSLILEFGKIAKELGLPIYLIEPKCIIGTGEQVIDRQKEAIENIFDATFVNEYGCTEAGVIGLECKHGNMHVMAQNLVVEVIKDGKQVLDEYGEIYVTELNSFSFPLIRYKVGDFGKIVTKPCGCGLKTPLLEVKKGRLDSYIVTPSGKRIYDAIFAYTLKKGVFSFKAIQISNYTIEVYVVPNNDFKDFFVDDFTEKLNSLTGYEMDIRIFITDSLPRDKSGKIRYFIPLQKNFQ